MRKKKPMSLDEAVKANKPGHVLVAVKGGFIWEKIDDDDWEDDSDEVEEDEDEADDDAQPRCESPELKTANQTIKKLKAKVKKLEAELATYREIVG